MASCDPTGSHSSRPFTDSIDGSCRHRMAPPVHLELQIPTQLLAEDGLPKYASSVRSFSVPSSSGASSSATIHSDQDSDDLKAAHSEHTNILVTLNTAHRNVGPHLDNLLHVMRHPDPKRRKPRVHLDCSDAEVRAWALDPPWHIPDPPLPPSARSSCAPQHRQGSHDSREGRVKRESEEYEASKAIARWTQHDFEKKVLEAQAWRTSLALPPFLPVLYSDYILAERKTVWRYDAKDRSMMHDHGAREAWATVKVRPVEERVGDGIGEGVAQEAMETDDKYLKKLVRNLAEKGAVSSSTCAWVCSGAHRRLVSSLMSLSSNTPANSSIFSSVPDLTSSS